MSKFSPGDLATITKTMTNKNVGVVVQIVEFLGPFENLGNTWLVRAKSPIETACTESGNVNDLYRFRHPESWMKKIEPPPVGRSVEEQKLVEKILEKAAKLNW